MIALALVTLGLLGNLAPTKPVKITSEDLAALGAAYSKCYEENRRGLAGFEDLSSYLRTNKTDSERLVELLKTKEVVFQYNVSLGEMADGASKTILAYVKSAPKEGGLVLFADGKVKQLTEAEFKNYKIAKPTIVDFDLEVIVRVYQVFDEIEKKAPSKAEELGPWLAGEKVDSKRLVDLIRNEDIIFIFNVRLLDIASGIGTSHTILAYERDAPTEGGLVVYADRITKRLTAAEFKKANVAKPKKD